MHGKGVIELQSNAIPGADLVNGDYEVKRKERIGLAIFVLVLMATCAFGGLYFGKKIAAKRADRIMEKKKALGADPTALSSPEGGHLTTQSFASNATEPLAGSPEVEIEDEKSVDDLI